MRIAVTGAAGDFGTAILRALTDDERASELIGIDRAPLRLEHPKLGPSPATCAPNAWATSSRAARR